MKIVRQHESRQICRRIAGFSLAFAAILPFAALADNGANPTPQPTAPNASTSQLSTSSYTNHAGNVISGVVVALDLRNTTISNATESAKLPLSIFPEPEQRRIAADFVIRQGNAGQVELLRVPAAVKRAVTGSDRAIARSRKRAEKGLCTKAESDDFCAKSAAALKSYLDKQVKEGVITSAERQAIGR
jgi:hypothetical protein